MIERSGKNVRTPAMKSVSNRSARFSSDEPTVELVVKAQNGDSGAIEALMQRCLSPLRRWAHGRVPPVLRGAMNTGDVVQEAVLRMLRRLKAFEPRHVGAMQGYLRRSVINLLRDALRRIGRQAEIVALTEEPPSDMTSPLEAAIAAEQYAQYRNALRQLRRRDRELVIAHIEAQWSLGEIARAFEMSTSDAARMAISRALRRLRAEMVVRS